MDNRLKRSEMRSVPTEVLDDGYQLRIANDVDGIHFLAESIRRHGFLQTIEIGRASCRERV